MKVESEIRDLKRKIGETKQIRFKEDMKDKIDEKEREIKCIK